MSKTITRVRTLREEFDWLLGQLGVSCFTLFAEDLWQPLVLVPQEVDTALYYPEATYAGPDDAAVSRIESEIAVQKASGLGRVAGVVGAFFEDATSSPLRRMATPPAHPEAFKPLYSSFVDREQILSSAVFMPESGPRLASNTKKEVLFLNFRKKTKFTDKLKVRLLHLAGKMLDRVPVQVNDRNRGAYAPARTMIRAFTSLLREMNNQLNDPSRRFDEPFFNSIATRLRDVLLRKPKAADPAASAPPVSPGPGSPSESSDRKGSQPQMIVSIYLCESSKGKRVPCAWPSRDDLGRHQVLNVIGSSSNEHLRPTQKLYDTGSSSVTICSATTGGTLMLPRIDPFWDPTTAQGDPADGSNDGLKIPPQGRRRTVETSLELISFQMYLAQSLLASKLLPTGKTGPTGAGSEFGFSVEEIREGSNGPCARLIIHTPYPGAASGSPEEQRNQDEEWDRRCNGLLEALLNSELGKRWPDLAKKAECRMKCQYAHIFGALDKVWELPSAEVCVPIRFAGQTIGCVNIESKQTDYFPPTVIGLLNSLAGIIGTAAARNRDIEMLDCLDNATKAIHSHEYVNEIKTAGGGTDNLPFHLRDDRYKLCELAKAVAKACWADVCTIVRTGLHVDDPTRFLATSSFVFHESTSWALPRAKGLAAWVAENSETGFVGLWVSRTSEGKPPRCFGLYHRQDAPIEMRELEQRQLDIEPNEEFVPPESSILSIRLPNTAEAARGSARTIVALSFSRWMFDDPESGKGGVEDKERSAPASMSNSPSANRRERYLRYVYSVCVRLASIASHWESRLLQELTEAKDARHSVVAQTFRDISGFLKYGEEGSKNRDVSPAMCARVLDNVFLQSQVSEYLLPRANAQSLESVEESSVYGEGSIHDVIRAAWELADWLRMIGEKPVELSSDIKVSFADTTCSRLAPYLYFLLHQCFLNSMKYSDSAAPKISLTVTGDANRSEWTLTDVAGGSNKGFPPSMLRDHPEYRRRMPTLLSGTVGRGFDLMVRAARKLAPSSKLGHALEWGNVEEQERIGTRIVFHVEGWTESPENHNTR